MIKDRKRATKNKTKRPKGKLAKEQRTASKKTMKAITLKTLYHRQEKTSSFDKTFLFIEDSISQKD